MTSPLTVVRFLPVTATCAYGVSHNRILLSLPIQYSILSALIHVLQISNKSIDYIPFHKAIILKGKGEEDDELKEELEELQETVKGNFSRISHQFDDLGVIKHHDATLIVVNKARCSDVAIALHCKNRSVS